jgi:hypothetical protein
MLQTLSTKQFDYDAPSRTLSADISDFGKHFTWGRVYDDACDAGVRIMSTITGHVALFVVIHEERDGDGDVTKWVLKAVRERGPRNPLLDTLKVVIYND